MLPVSTLVTAAFDPKLSLDWVSDMKIFPTPEAHGT
jgi:hypothetical protein